MPTMSEEELEELRSQNEKLREEISSAESEKAEAEAEARRAHEATQLLAENARLKAQLASSKAQAEHAASGASIEPFAKSAVDQVVAAQAALENPTGVPVDTNTGKSKADEPAPAATPPAKKETTAKAVSETKEGGNS